MHTLQYVRDLLPENFFKLKIIHHFGPTSLLCDSDFVENNKVRLSDDIVILQVNSLDPPIRSYVNRVQLETPSQSIEILIDKYIKWISKIINLKTYIEKNYNTLPKYILYLDGSDVLIINDILDPKSMLDYYNAKILFNCEPSLCHTGFNFPSEDYYDPLFREYKVMYKELNFKKYGVSNERSINAGVILGEKDELLKILNEAYEYMTDDYNKGFPYGCMDDQHMFRFLHIKHFDTMSCDIFNHFFLFAYPKTYETSEENWENFEYFKKNYVHLYNNKFNKSIYEFK